MRIARMLVPSLIAVGCLITAEREAHAGPVSFGIGPIGAFGGNFLDKPDEKKYPINGQRVEVSPSYPGFGGTTSGFGLALDLRFISFVGLEVDVIKMSNKGTADIDITAGGIKKTYELEIGHDAWHIPVLVKGVLPTPLVSPFVVAGLEFVRTSNATASVSENAFSVGARTDNYTFFTGGFGFEFKLPIPLPAIDSLRIPVSFRGSYFNPGGNIEDRAEYTTSGNTVTKVTYDTRWRFQALATLSIQAYF
jgi:opacity protein-like surface antigen